MKTVWRTYKGKMPERLVSLYEILQEELNYVLSNKDIRNKILYQVDYSKHKGDVLTQYTNLFGYVRQRPNWDNVPVKSWYFRMLLENVRRTYESLKEKHEIYICLKENGFTIDDQLYAKFRSKKIYASSGNLRNIIRQSKNGSVPTLPMHQKFVMDYSISNEINCLKLDNQTFKFRVGPGTSDEDYLIYHVDLPSSLRINLTARCAKPKFYLNRKGRYLADLAYEVRTESHEETGHEETENNVLGVDLGEKKLYSATVLYEDGTTSQEYIQSKQLTRSHEKLNRLKKEKARLKKKQERSKDYSSSEDKFERRVNHLEGICAKIIRIKEHEARLVGYELTELAKKHFCKTIAVENLHWLDSQSGKWNHSDIQTKVKETAELYGIKVEEVNCSKTSSTHPVTGEIGECSGRIVKFSDGTSLDRDHIASVNIANRAKHSHKAPKRIFKSTKTPTKFKATRSRKEILADMKAFVEAKKNKAGTEIVVFAMRNDSTSPHFGLIDQARSLSLLQKDLHMQCRL